MIWMDKAMTTYSRRRKKKRKPFDLRKYLRTIYKAYDRPFTWQEGRQTGGYWKMMIMPTLGFRDAYLIYYPQGAFIQAHMDPLPAGLPGVLLRANFVLRAAEQGGQFWASNEAVVRRFLDNRLIVFRPDYTTHGVRVIEKGERLVLSFGFWIPVDALYTRLLVPQVPGST